MDRAFLAGMLDHAFLRPELTTREVQDGLLDVHELGLASVCVRLCDIELAVSMLEGSKPAIGTVIGFPHGTTTSTCKAFEAAVAIKHGAEELDMVINIGALKGGDHEYVEDEIVEIVEVAGGRHVKVILETAYLTDAEKVMGCKIAEVAGATFVKTSTGFAPTGATLEDVRLMRATVGDRLGVKASGGIRTLESVLSFIEAGATRIGTSASRAILDGLRPTLVSPQGVA